MVEPAFNGVAGSAEAMPAAHRRERPNIAGIGQRCDEFKWRALAMTQLGKAESGKRKAETFATLHPCALALKIGENKARATGSAPEEMKPTGAQTGRRAKTFFMDSISFIWS